eukprot:6146615-Amphidinium_carterae.3
MSHPSWHLYRKWPRSLRSHGEPQPHMSINHKVPLRFDLVDRYNLGQPDNMPEKLLPWILQHACFTINRYLVHSDGLTNYRRRGGVKYNAAICNFGEMVLADVKHIAVKKLAIRNQDSRAEGGRYMAWQDYA